MTTAPAGGHAALMDGVYRYQRHVYDLTRKYYLLGCAGAAMVRGYSDVRRAVPAPRIRAGRHPMITARGPLPPKVSPNNALARQGTVGPARRSGRAQRNHAGGQAHWMSLHRSPDRGPGCTCVPAQPPISRRSNARWTSHSKATSAMAAEPPPTSTRW